MKEYDDGPDDEPTDEELGLNYTPKKKKSNKQKKDDAYDKEQARTSNLPPMYDPTPDYNDVPKDEYRPPVPKMQLHDKGSVQPIDTEGSLLTNDIEKVKLMSVKERKQRFLSSKCAINRGSSNLMFMVRERLTGRWFATHKLSARSQLWQDWGGERTRFDIKQKDIDVFLAGANKINVNGTADIPGYEQMITFRNTPFINSFVDTRMGYDQQYDITSDKGLKILLEIITVNLMNRPDYNFEATLAEILSDDKDSVLRWVFHWFANIYQNPGVSMSTTLWMIGKSQGIGKTMLGNIMSNVLGGDRVNFVNKSELVSEWNDFIEGRYLLIGDEVKFRSRTDFYEVLKRYVGNPQIELRQRNIGVRNVPNVSNWMFISNDRKTIAIDANDRRNTFVETNPNQEQGRKIANAFWDDLTDTEQDQAYKSMCGLLAIIDVDYRFVNNNIKTPLWRELVSLGQNPVIRFIAQSRKIQVGRAEHMTKLFEWYKDWCDTVNISNPNQKTEQFFAGRINDIVSENRYMESPRSHISRRGERAKGYMVKERPETESTITEEGPTLVVDNDDPKNAEDLFK